MFALRETPRHTIKMEGDRAQTSALAAPGEQWKRLDARLGEFVLHVNFLTGKLVLSRANRPDLAHLTVDWMTSSGELDIHLTYGHEARTRDPAAELYVPIAKVPLAELERFGEGIAAGLEDVAFRSMRAFRKYRPGWLARRGYLVMLLDETVMFDWFKRSAPRRRGKYRVNPENVFNAERLDPAVLAAMSDGLNDPRVLHTLPKVPMHAPISAIRFPERGSSVRENILLKWQIGPDGTFGWWGMTNRASTALGRDMARHFLTPVLPLIHQRHTVAFEKIVAGLGLSDFEPTRRFSEGVLEFLGNPAAGFRPLLFPPNPSRGFGSPNPGLGSR